MRLHLVEDSAVCYMLRSLFTELKTFPQDLPGVPVKCVRLKGYVLPLSDTEASRVRDLRQSIDWASGCFWTGSRTVSCRAPSPISFA